jgi:hypothetical protein
MIKENKKFILKKSFNVYLEIIYKLIKMSYISFKFFYFFIWLYKVGITECFLISMNEVDFKIFKKK